MVITPESTINLHFVLRLTDGSVVEDTHRYSQPARFTMGDGSLPKTIESRLLHLKKGDKAQFTLPPEEAFGLPSSANNKVLLRNQFASDTPLAIGLVMMFQQPNQPALPGIITAFDEKSVTVDFNHPLSGQILVFEVEILEVA